MQKRVPVPKAVRKKRPNKIKAPVSPLLLVSKMRSLAERVAKRIDDIDHENYTVPALAHQNRKLKSENRAVVLGQDYTYTENDYVDAREVHDYDASALVARTSIAAEDAKQLQEIQAVLEDLLNGDGISTRRLRAILTEHQYDEYLGSLTEVRYQCEIVYGDGMPEQLKRYNDKLKAADFINAKYEKMNGMWTTGARKYRHDTLSKTLDKAEHLYENAVECLEEIYGIAERGDWGPDIRAKLDAWMDREVVFGVKGKISIDCDGVPRVRGSRSNYAKDSGLPKLSKRLKRQECVLSALLAAGCNSAFDLPKPYEISEDQKTKLSEKLKRWRSDDMFAKLNPEKN